MLLYMKIQIKKLAVGGECKEIFLNLENQWNLNTDYFLSF